MVPPVKTSVLFDHSLATFPTFFNVSFYFNKVLRGNNPCPFVCMSTIGFGSHTWTLTPGVHRGLLRVDPERSTGVLSGTD